MSDIAEEEHQWGLVKRGVFHPLTNFIFKLKYSVIADTPGNSGYVVSLTRHMGGTGKAWFRSQDLETPKDLARALNSSFPGRNLFNFMEYKQQGHMIRVMDQSLADEDVKRLVTFVGEQDDGSMVLAPELILNKDGKKVTQRECQFIWVPDWPTSPNTRLGRTISLPISLTSLKEYVSLVMDIMANNAPQSILALASMVSCSNYSQIIETTGHFNLPLLTGPPMSGKTLAATCAAFVLGCSRNQILSRSTIAYLTEQFCVSTLPFVWDDPSTPNDVKQVAIDLGNGALRGRNGCHTAPRTGCLVTANFDMDRELKYSSRVLQIRFENLDKVKRPGEGVKLEDAAKAASSSLPYLLAFAKVDREDIITSMQKIVNKELDIRQLEGIAIPLAVCRKMLQAIDRYDILDEVEAYCNGPTHNHTPAYVGGDSFEASENNMVDWLTQLVSNNEVDLVVRVHGGNVFIKSAEMAKLLQISRTELKQTAANLGGSSSIPFRIPVTDEKTSRCFRIPATPKLTAVLKDQEQNSVDEEAVVTAEEIISQPPSNNRNQHADTPNNNDGDNDDMHNAAVRSDEAEYQDSQSVNTDRDQYRDCEENIKKTPCNRTSGCEEEGDATSGLKLPTVRRSQRTEKEHLGKPDVVEVKWGRGQDFFRAEVLNRNNHSVRVRFLQDGKIKIIKKDNFSTHIRDVRDNN